MHLKPSRLVLLFVVGCTAPPQVLSGRVAPGFPSTITEVAVTSSEVQSWNGDTVVRTAPVAADGTFTLAIPPMGGLKLHLVGTGQARVVFPRHTGTIDASFAIRPNGVAFDLGAIRYVGAAGTTSFAFNMTTTQCDGEGHDPNGATCVDDGDQNSGTCDDGGGNNEQDGENGSNETSGDQTEGPDMGEAVAEHNFPADGCADGNDNGGDTGGDMGGETGGA